jgi:hypothetical protein
VDPAREAAGLGAVRIHDLRHAHASWLLAGGADLQVVKERLGHASIATTERYLHSLPNYGRPLPDGMLAAAGSVTLWVIGRIRLSPVDPHLVEPPVKGAVISEMPGKGNGVDLAVPGWGLLRAEHLTGVVVDVLPIEEHDDAGGHRGASSQ